LQNLSIDTLFIGQELIYLPICQSTNSYALELLTSDTPIEGTVIYTSQQTAGRGQRGNIWEAEPDQNLTFSIILYPSFLDINAHFYLNMAIALAVRDFLVSILGEEVKIKWPNDILYQSQKICGILIENSIRKNVIDKSVVGIGVNINQMQFNSPLAGSLKKITGRDYLLEPLLVQLLKQVEEKYLSLRNSKYNELKIKYLRSLFRYQERAWFQQSEELFEGEIIGVEESGHLRIQANNQLLRFDFKEVSFVF
jgi:BirA family biotin operon repressor/biotin-[acetyl-CoA-carboxylase] ligase